MNNDQETALEALYQHLVTATKISFTGDSNSGSPIITSVSSVTGLVEGLPVFGPGVPALAVIDSFDATAMTVTLDQNIGSNGTGAAFTAGFQTTNRRLQHWSKVTSQPALFLTHTGSEDEWGTTILSRTTVEAEIWIYSKAGADLNAWPDQALNALIYLIRNALAPDNAMTGTFTLGGQCQWCRIEGKTDSYGGDQDGQSRAVIPIRILLP